MKITAGDFYFVTSLLLAIWFSYIGMAWVYGIALFLAYPAALLSLLLWYLGKKRDTRKKRYRFIPWILGFGLALSLGMLVYLLWFY